MKLKLYPANFYPSIVSFDVQFGKSERNVLGENKQTKQKYFFFSSENKIQRTGGGFGLAGTNKSLVAASFPKGGQLKVCVFICSELPTKKV